MSGGTLHAGRGQDWREAQVEPEVTAERRERDRIRRRAEQHDDQVTLRREQVEAYGSAKRRARRAHRWQVPKARYDIASDRRSVAVGQQAHARIDRQRAVEGPDRRCVVAGAAVEFFALGYYLDHDLIRYTPGIWTPEGWYPLSIPIERVVVTWGLLSLHKAFRWALLGGLAASGIVFGTGLLAMWLVVRSFLARQRIGRRIKEPNALA